VEIRGERDEQVAQIFGGVAQTSVAAVAEAAAETMTGASGGQ